MLSKQRMKNLILRKAKKSGLPPQQLYGLFAMDQLVAALSKTEYVKYLVLKGGFLLTSAQGLDYRSTGDLDFTVKGFELNKHNITEMINSVQNDSINPIFEIKGFKETRESFYYKGIEVKLIYHNDGTKIPFNIDFTTGEDLIQFKHYEKIKSIFTDEEYSLITYPIEQILADKFYTLLAYGVINNDNSRMKDYYDIYLLTKTNRNINLEDINIGINKIMNQRGNYINHLDYQEIIKNLKESDTQNQLWENYSAAMPYAESISFEDLFEQIQLFSNQLVIQIKNKKIET